MNIAVIGVGNMGKNHARIYFEHPDVNLVAVCDINKERCDEFSKKHNCKGYYDVDSLLVNEKLDGVSIVVPTSVHKEVVEKVVKYKINILLEKPISDNLKDSEYVKNLVKKSTVVCVVGHIERYNPALRKMLKMIFNGDLGSLYYINVMRQGFSSKGITDTNILANLGIHDLEIINYILKNLNDFFINIKGVKEARINKLGDLYRVSMKTKKQCVVNLIVDSLTPFKNRKLYVCGENGLLELDYISQKLIFYTNGSADEYKETNKVSLGKSININVVPKEPLLMEITNFIKSIEGKEKPFVTIDDAFEGIRLLEKIESELGD